MPVPLLAIPWLIAETAEVVIGALNRVSEERGLSVGELDKLIAFRRVRDEARRCQVLEHGATGGGSMERLLDLVADAGEASRAGSSIVELLGIGDAIPPDWRRAPLTSVFLNLLGAIRLTDDLNCICAAGGGDTRQRQLAAMCDAQGAFGRYHALYRRQASTERNRAHRAREVEAKLVVATIAIGLDLPAIGAEGAALRKRAR